jgi:hypothetical protein
MAFLSLATTDALLPILALSLGVRLAPRRVLFGQVRIGG